MVLSKCRESTGVKNSQGLRGDKLASDILVRDRRTRHSVFLRSTF